MLLQVKPTPAQEAFIREGIASGRFQSADQVAAVALQRWEEYERRRAELVAELEAADRSIDRGEGLHADTPEELTAIFDQIRREARCRYERTHKTVK